MGPRTQFTLKAYKAGLFQHSDANGNISISIYIFFHHFGMSSGIVYFNLLHQSNNIQRGIIMLKLVTFWEYSLVIKIPKLFFFLGVQ